jgi:hypothetical protein
LAWQQVISMAKKKQNRYELIIESIFLKHYEEGAREIYFGRQEIVDEAVRLKIELPKNLGDLIYTFRYRGQLPQIIRDKAPDGEHWIIRPAGDARYCFALSQQPVILPNLMLAETKIPDSTPGLIELYAFSDEQALLAKLRYNRLIDTFTSLTCYSLQSHLRTKVSKIGQVEVDEVYVGLDRKGAHYVLPVQAKGGKDQINIVQIEQDMAMCAAKFPSLQCRPIAGQFMNDNLIALFEFVLVDQRIAILHEKHYRLIPAEQVDAGEIKGYHSRTE